MLRPFVCLHSSCISDDDDEEEAEDQPTETAGSVEPTVDPENTEVEPPNPDEIVKADTDQPAPAKKARERTPSYELHIYSVEELSKFKKRERIADSELLDGTISYCLFLLIYSSAPPRKTEEW